MIKAITIAFLIIICVFLTWPSSKYSDAGCYDGTDCTPPEVIAGLFGGYRYVHTVISTGQLKQIYTERYDDYFINTKSPESEFFHPVHVLVFGFLLGTGAGLGMYMVKFRKQKQ